ncbi:transglycosylase SLT domain-containing protein [uncultured Pseudodesulfovibrio sp.]|uniref:lytic transglycosylase domain-containing protein n=1 Tax=uncultured Pseudodesulfovibrio sp. TaxID=2035858 RepID=UPI0029C83158|nr:transglycosylase SLT domain-containing protein [uncultured Pseudodesulfovibrio sp.]
MPIRHIHIPLLAVFLLFLWSLPGAAQSPSLAEPMKTAVFPSLESAIRIKGPLEFCGEYVPIHLPEVRERLEKELLLMLWDRAQVILWLKRTGRYFPHIEVVLKGANMPDDLKYVAVIESALKPHAGSNKGARGIWQFIPSTARNYDLVVDYSMDERRNFFLSTKAAVRYLGELHDMFGSWTLGCAGYNMGEQGLKKQIEKQEVKDYYRLHLPNETERYIPRAIAAKLILSDPARYGFDLRPGDYYTPTSFDRIKLKAKYPTPIALVAKAAKTYYKNIRDLNPQILTDVIPKGDHVLYLPEGAAEEFAKQYHPLIAKYRKTLKPVTYVVKRGDSLTGIARRHDMSLWQLCKLNKLSTKSTIRPGQKLHVGE